jgi:Do/DeqQ family serine protease
MKTLRELIGTRTKRAGVATLASALLVTGAAWHTVAADATAPPSQAAAAPQTVRPGLDGRPSYADIVDVVAPAVVTIRTQAKARVSPTMSQDDDLLRRFFGDRFDRMPQPPRNFRRGGLGSGVIVSGDGYILTNHHVVDGAEDVRVEFTDGRSFDAQVVGSDEPTDLAVLKVDASGLPSMTFGNSDAVRVGDVVLAVGNPLGIGQTVTMGIISARGRSTGSGDGSYEDFLQTDAPINQGNSGGALVNTKGELVGINSQIISPSSGNIGIGFAIPAGMARHVMDELRSGGRVRRAQLGVTVQGVTSDIAASLGLKEVRGALVNSVADGSAAADAGVKVGDIILSFNGQPVQDTNSLRNRVANAEPGSTASLAVLRDGSEKTLSAKLDEAAGSVAAGRGADGEAADKTALGVSVAPVTPELAAEAGAPRDVKGLMVQDVDPDSRAADAGIQPGDIIQQVNGKPVQTVDELRTAVRAAADRPALLLLNRKGANQFMTVRPS